MKLLNEKEPLGPLDKTNVNDPRNFNAKDPKMLNSLNNTFKNAQASQMAKDVASSFGKSQTEPKNIPYMPDYKRSDDGRSISGPITKPNKNSTNEETKMSLVDKTTLSVADAVRKIMEASAKKADKDYDKDGKIESPKDEVWGSRLRAAKMAGKLKEEEELDEAFPTVADAAKRMKDAESSKFEKKKTATGTIYSRKYKSEPDTDMDDEPKKKGKKKLSEMRKQYAEEVDNETFTKEMKDQKAKFDGKKKGGDVAKPSVQAVKQEEVELDERTLTSGETKKKEEYVKGMKKSISGFKSRYGDRAKSVMYATATKMAKKD